MSKEYPAHDGNGLIAAVLWSVMMVGIGWGQIAPSENKFNPPVSAYDTNVIDGRQQSAETSQPSLPWNMMGSENGSNSQNTIDLGVIGSIHMIPPAASRVTIARQRYYQAQNALDQAMDRVRAQNDPALNQAKAAQDRAWEDYNRARRQAVQTLLNDPDYKALSSLRDEMTAKIEGVRRLSPHDQENIAALAASKLQYAMLVSQMEREAMDSNPQVQQARAQLNAAAAKISEIKARIVHSIRFGPEIASARQALTQAKIEYFAAQTYAAELRDARDQVLNYAWYRNHFPQNLYYGDYVSPYSWWWWR